jgi:oligopeptide/dipeptide ABC transporter ATP-binding protein
MATLIETIDLTKHYRPSQIWILSGLKSIKAVEKVSLKIEEGQVYGLVGESGCGKTTVGRLILRLVDATGGKVLFEGKNILEFGPAGMKEYRRNAQIVFQNPFLSMNPRRSIFDSLSVGFDNYSMGTAKERREWLEQLMLKVGLEPTFLTRYPHQFSGGQLQRIVVARALSLKPRFIVADEPVSALDVSIQAQILNLMRNLQQEYQFTMMFISHDLRVIRHMSDSIGVMYMGRLVEKASKEELFRNPLHPYTQALLDAAPRIELKPQVKGELIQGEVWDSAPPETGCIFYNRCRKRADACKVTPQTLKEAGNDHQVACMRAI